MSQVIRYCVGGKPDRPCTAFGYHLEDCDDERCKGCAPKLATQGHLCDTCDTYLRQWLDATSTDEYQPNSILWVHWWLGLAQTARIARSPWGDKIRSGKDDLPSPLSEAILDCRQLLEDRIYIAEERLRQHLGQRLSEMPTFRMADSVAYLSRMVLRIEDDPDLCRHVYERLQDSMINAHLLAPWRATAQRIDGIACPHCQRVALRIFGGDDFATCTSCGNTVVSRRFDQWVALLHHESGVG